MPPNDQRCQIPLLGPEKNEGSFVFRRVSREIESPHLEVTTRRSKGAADCFLQEGMERGEANVERHTLTARESFAATGI